MQSQELRENLTKLRALYALFSQARELSDDQAAQAELRLAKQELLVTILQMKKAVKQSEDSLV
jgi:hypothetical protein